MDSKGDIPETVAKTKEQKLQELARRREAKEVSETDFNSNQLRWLVELDEPLDRNDLETDGPQALVLSSEEFQ